MAGSRPARLFCQRFLIARHSCARNPGGSIEAKHKHGVRGGSSHQTRDVIVEDQHDERNDEQEPDPPGHLARAHAERAAEE